MKHSPWINLNLKLLFSTCPLKNKGGNKLNNISFKNKRTQSEQLKLLPTRITLVPFGFLPLSPTHTPSFSHTHSDASREVVVSMVLSPGDPGWGCRKGRGVNWVSAWCGALWGKAWSSSFWCFVTHTHPERYRWGGKVRKQRAVISIVSFTAVL